MSGIIAQNTLDSSGLVKAPESGGGVYTLIKKLTASSSSTLSFVNGSSDVVLDSTYKEYLFTFKSIHPSTNTGWLVFQGSTNTGSSYGVTIQTSQFDGHNNESGSSQGLQYETTTDQANGTAFQRLSWEVGYDNDQTMSGELRLFNPSGTVFVKHFDARCNMYHPSDYTADVFTAGYFNTTSAIDAIQFKMESPAVIDAGDICLFGLKT